jgi:protein-S-isoprenylcysteine O-methyltransferase Ste14
MGTDLICRSLYGILFLLSILPRMQGMKRRGSSSGQRHDNRALNLFGLICMLLFFTSTLLYVFWPQSLNGSYFTLPTSLRYSGAVIALCGSLLMIGAEKQLGHHFSQYLEIQQDHQLIDSGFYRYVRHPIYSAYVPLFIGYILLSSNLFIAAVLGSMLCYCILRIPREEQMMLEAFGERYQQYQQRTARLIPKIY